MNDKTSETIAKIYSELAAVGNRIGSLAEEDLTALADEIENGLSAEAADAGGAIRMALWRGTLAATNEQLGIRRARRTGKGTWYALLQVWRWNADRSEADAEIEKAAKCGSKKEALERCRELLREHAHLYDELVDIEVRAHPEMEWKPPEGMEIVD